MALLPQVDYPDDDEIGDLLDDLNDLDEGLSEWEISFIDSLTHQFSEKGTLTQAQTDKLREVHDKHCG